MNDKEDDMNFGIKLVDESQQTPRVEGNQKYQDQAKQNNDENEAMNADGNNYDLASASHPVACIFTFVFKVSAFLCFFLIGHALSDIITFIFVVMCGAFDFWVVKNVTGRLLVGLRWWSDFDTDGKEIWKYESYDRQFKANNVDASFFWTSQILGTGVWAFFVVYEVLTFSPFWLLLVFINFSLCGINLYSYYKCRKEYSSKLDGMKKKWAKEGLVHMAGKMF